MNQSFWSNLLTTVAGASETASALAAFQPGAAPPSQAGRDDFNFLHGTWQVKNPLRTYDPRADQWSLWWMDNHHAPGVLQPPVVGAFDGCVGVFTGEDQHQGRPVIVRFIWTVTGERRARWEQAFSIDHGTSWETNWIMDFRGVGQ